MATVSNPQHTCPKCRQTLPLTAFKLRSRSQGRSPSWCRPCVNLQARAKRARHRERLSNECIRRIRFGSTPDRVEVLFTVAAQFAGGIDVLAARLDARLHSHNLRSALGGATLFFKLMLAATPRIPKNSEGLTY